MIEKVVHLGQTQASGALSQYTCSWLVFIDTYSYIIYCTLGNKWRAQWKREITVFDNPKRSKVNLYFLESRKITRLDFNSIQIQLLNFSHNSLLDNENASSTFDLLGSSKMVIPFFHCALQMLVSKKCELWPLIICAVFCSAITCMVAACIVGSDTWCSLVLM